MKFWMMIQDINKERAIKQNIAFLGWNKTVHLVCCFSFLGEEK